MYSGKIAVPPGGGGIRKKFYIFLISRYRGLKYAALISFILNIKKDFDYCFLLANAVIILNDCDQVCNYLLLYFQLFQEIILRGFCLK
jgi:hypothetical protein